MTTADHSHPEIERMLARLVDFAEATTITLRDMVSSLTRIETRLDSVEVRMSTVETRMAALEARMGNVEARLGTVEARVGNVEDALRGPGRN